MKKQKTQSSLDDLQAGIKHLLTRSRCPFSETDRQLLKQCSEELQRLKERDERDEGSDLETLSKLMELLANFFGIYEAVKTLL